MKISKRIIALLLVLVLSSGLVACSKTEKPAENVGKTEVNEEFKYTDGVYKGVGNGNGGPIELEVSVTDGKVADIKVLSQKETAILSDGAFEQLLAGVIENQSLNLDSITGATVTSFGIMTAVKDALTQAGGNDEYFKANEKINLGKVEDKTEFTYDVVVIGAGGAGLSAAIEARQAGAEVILLEKLSGLGGNTLVSGGGLNIPGTVQQKNLGIEDSIELFVQDTLNGGDNINSEKLVRVIGENALESIDW